LVLIVVLDERVGKGVFHWCVGAKPQKTEFLAGREVQPQEKPIMAASDTNLPWVEKYRPKQLDDVISHDQIVGTSASLQQMGQIWSTLMMSLFFGSFSSQKAD